MTSVERSARVALATCEGFEDLTEDDRLLLPPLHDLGIRAEPIRWDAAVDWTIYDAVLIRSTWDYYKRPAEFAAWLDGRARNGPALWNPAGVLRWNMDKHYLIQLEAAGLPTVATEWVPRGTEITLPDLLADRGWDRAVVKPAISAGAWRTFTVDRASAASCRDAFASLVAAGDVMVQPFLEQIQGEGEWSLVFFDGVLEYSLLKRPGADDYRVQERHGGTTIIAEPPDALVRQAEAVLAQAPGSGDLLYARVDGVRNGDRLILIELEVLEPVLFFGLVPGAAGRLAASLARRL